MEGAGAVGLFVHSYSPLTIMACALDTGCCRLRGRRTPTSFVGYRGSSPAVPLQDGSLLMVLHRRVEIPPAQMDYALPAMYHHRVVVVSLGGAASVGVGGAAALNYTWAFESSLYMIGPPFRLPEVPGLNAGAQVPIKDPRVTLTPPLCHR